jgi:RHS repeat-associated protein
LQPHRYTSYERDANGGDEAQQRRYQAWWTRFSQPDPSDASYDLSDPQTFNRYSYVKSDPVNRTDPTGLDWQDDLGPPPVMREPDYGDPVVINVWAPGWGAWGSMRHLFRFYRTEYEPRNRFLPRDQNVPQVTGPSTEDNPDRLCTFIPKRLHNSCAFIHST